MLNDKNNFVIIVTSCLQKLEGIEINHKRKITLRPSRLSGSIKGLPFD